jgi:hypothetical protein
MSKKSSIILAIAAFFVGLFIGAQGVVFFYGHLTSRQIIASNQAETATTVVLLKELRAGNTTNAIEILETRLDCALMEFGSIFTDPREMKLDPMYIKTLQRARDYRIQFPHKSGLPAVDEATAKTFGLLDAPTGH